MIPNNWEGFTGFQYSMAFMQWFIFISNLANFQSCFMMLTACFFLKGFITVFWWNRMCEQASECVLGERWGSNKINVYIKRNANDGILHTQKLYIGFHILKNHRKWLTNFGIDGNSMFETWFLCLLWLEAFIHIHT